jgi:hypothetical protein
MKALSWLSGLLLPLLVVALAAAADDKKDEEGFVPMFNGRDLSGWVNVDCAPSTFYVKDGEIITTGKPTGYLRTDKQYENFIAEFDWMHVPATPGAVANSGFFVWADPIPAVGTGYARGIEVQVLVNLTYKNKKGEITATSQGDLFSIHGASCVPERPHPDGWARCLPSENHCKGEREWNHYRVEADEGVIKLAVNGHVVSGVSKCSPRKGYLALESEGSECHFRNLKIKELPSTNPKPDEIANVAAGHRLLLDGLDLDGWKADKDAWKVADGVARSAGDAPLVSDGQFKNFELIFDWKLPATSADGCRVEIGTPDKNAGAIAAQVKGGEVFFGKNYTKDADTGSRYPADAVKPGQWNRTLVRVGGGEWALSINGKPVGSIKGDPPTPGPVAFRNAAGLELRNIFIREIKP